jgi:hypothetical protein
MTGTTMELTENEQDLLNVYTAADETGEDSDKWRLNDLLSLLRSTENLEERQFEMANGKAQFSLPEQAGSRLTMSIAGEDFGVTQEAFLQSCKEIGLPKKFSEETPLELVLQNLNYWFDNLGAEKKALLHSGRVVSLIRPGTSVYSTVDLITAMVEELAELGHHDVFFDKVSHNIEETQLVLVLNDWESTMPNGDTLKGGFQFQNSILAKKALTITPVLWFDSAGVYGTSMSSLNHAKWDRKMDPARAADDPFEDAYALGEADEPFDVYTWVHQTVKDLYGTLNREAQMVQNLHTRNMGAHAGSLLNDIYVRFRVPAPLRSVVQEEYADQTGQTLYDLWRAIATTSGAEDCTEKLNQQRHLMMVAGEIAAHPDSCNSCHRLTVEA